MKKTKSESSAHFYLDEAVFLGSILNSNNKPSNSIESKQKGIQSQNENTLEGVQDCLEIKDTVYGINFSPRNKKHEISMVEHPNKVFNTFDEKSCYIDKH